MQKKNGLMYETTFFYLFRSGNIKIGGEVKNLQDETRFNPSSKPNHRPTREPEPFMSILPPTDLEIITERLGRPPNQVKECCFPNLWSEHCSYRSSSKHLRMFPPGGERAVSRSRIGSLIWAVTA